MKTKNRKRPLNRLPKNVFSDIEKLFRTEKPIGCKKVEEISPGVFVATDETGRPVGFFGRRFMAALKDFGKLIEEKASPKCITKGEMNCISSAPVESQNNQRSATCIRETSGPGIRPSRHRVLFVIAADYTQFLRYLDWHWGKWQKHPNIRITYRFVTSVVSLLGREFNNDCKIILLRGWKSNKTSEFIKGVTRLTPNQVVGFEIKFQRHT